MHYLSGNNLSLDGIKIDKQPSDDYIMVSGTYGEVSWANKSLFIDPTPFEHYVGELYGGGVITDIWKEAGDEYFLIMSPQVCSYVNGGVLYKNTFNISNVQNALSGASWSSYGLSNSVIYSLQPGYDANVLTNGVAAALSYVNNDFGTGVFNDWFVPSFTELMTMVDNSNILNNSLSLLADTWGNSLLSNSGIIPAKIDYIQSNNYISSTEVSSDMLLNLGILTSDGVDIGLKSANGLIRPFRVGNVGQKSFTFDADWMVLTYKFTSGGNIPTGASASDLDTRTSFSKPIDNTLNNFKIGYLGFTTGGWDSGVYKGGITQPELFDSNNLLIGDPTRILNTLIYHGGDNTGTGMETVLINVTRFKQLYPNESHFIIDLRSAWWFNSWSPNIQSRFTSYPGLTAPVEEIYNYSGVPDANIQYWLNLTEPVVIGVEMFKGGKPRMDKSYTWTVAESTSYLNVDSYSKKVTMGFNPSVPPSTGPTTLVAQVKYDVVKGLCTLIKV